MISSQVESDGKNKHMIRFHCAQTNERIEHKCE